MPFNVSNLVKSLFRHSVIKPATPSRARLSVTALEDRTVPTPVVTIEALANVTEGGGATAAFRLTRSDTTGSLSVGFMPGGTAGSWSDYTYPFSVVFAPGAATANVTITPTNDTTSEATETITLSLVDGASYDITSPSSATVNLYDNDAQVVSVAKMDDAVEGGATGKFRLTRLGDLSSSLAVNVSVGGTATSGTDYTALGGAAVFAAGSATADVTVSAGSDLVYDPDETVTLSVSSGTGYTVSGSGATVAIIDDSSTVETLIHQETFQLTGASGTVNVTLTVTLNASGATGLYTWSYTVTNPSSNASSLTSFGVPIDGMDSDVGGLTSSIGWTGTVGTDDVLWAAGTGLSPGSTATFAFTTDPREVGPATVTATGGGGFFADLPLAPAPRQKAERPLVRAQFFGVTPGSLNWNNYKVSLDITTADGSAYTTGDINFNNVAGAEAARDLLYAYLINNNWAVEKVGTRDLAILGRVESDKTITAIKSLTYKFTDVSTGVDYASVPNLIAVGQVTVAPKP